MPVNGRFLSAGTLGNIVFLVLLAGWLGGCASQSKSNLVHITKVLSVSNSGVSIVGTLTNTLASDVHCDLGAWVLIGGGQTLPATSSSTCDYDQAVGGAPVVVAPGTSTRFELIFVSLQGMKGTYQLRFDNAGSYESHDINVPGATLAANQDALVGTWSSTFGPQRVTMWFAASGMFKKIVGDRTTNGTYKWLDDATLEMDTANKTVVKAIVNQGRFTFTLGTEVSTFQRVGTAGENEGPTPAGDPDVIAKSLDPSFPGGAVWQGAGDILIEGHPFKFPDSCQYIDGGYRWEMLQCGEYLVTLRG